MLGGSKSEDVCNLIVLGGWRDETIVRIQCCLPMIGGQCFARLHILFRLYANYHSHVLDRSFRGGENVSVISKRCYTHNGINPRPKTIQEGATTGDE